MQNKSERKRSSRSDYRERGAWTCRDSACHRNISREDALRKRECLPDAPALVCLTGIRVNTASVCDCASGKFTVETLCIASSLFSADMWLERRLAYWTVWSVRIEFSKKRKVYVFHSESIISVVSRANLISEVPASWKREELYIESELLPMRMTAEALDKRKASTNQF